MTHVGVTKTVLACTTSVAVVAAGDVELILQGGSFAAGEKHVANAMDYKEL